MCFVNIKLEPLTELGDNTGAVHMWYRHMDKSYIKKTNSLVSQRISCTSIAPAGPFYKATPTTHKDPMYLLKDLRLALELGVEVVEA